MFVIVQETYLAWMPSINKNATTNYLAGYGRQTENSSVQIRQF